MPFTDEEKHFIKILRKEKRYSSRKFIRNWSRRGLNHLIKKIDESDSTVRKSRSGRPRMKCVTFVSETFTWYGSNITNVWQEILVPMILAFSCEVVHEKI